MGQNYPKPKYTSPKRILLKPKIETIYKCLDCLHEKKQNRWVCNKCTFSENIILSKKIFPYKIDVLREDYKHGIIIRNLLFFVIIICFFKIFKS